MSPRKRTVCLVYLAAILLLLSGTSSVLAVSNGDAADRLSPQERSGLWLDSLARFAASHPNLTVEQQQVILDAVDLATPATFAMPHGQGRWQQTAGRALSDLIRHAEKSFSRNELGELFSRMGPLQAWLAATKVAPIPFCNCSPIGSRCGPNNAGICQTGCLSWTDSQGNNWVGICNVAPNPNPDPNPVDSD